MPVAAPPLPRAQVLPVNVTLRLKMFLPVGLGVTVPEVAQPKVAGMDKVPFAEMVAVIVCAAVVPVRDLPE